MGNKLSQVLKLSKVLEVIPFAPGGSLGMKVNSESKIREIQVETVPENEKLYVQYSSNGKEWTGEKEGSDFIRLTNLNRESILLEKFEMTFDYKGRHPI